MVIKEKLLGYSGCEVLLIENNNRIIVRKYADKKYSNRLKLQADKQNKFVSLFLKAPKIISFNDCKDGKYFIDMEYINGLNFNDYLLRKDIKSVKLLVDKLFNEILERKESGSIDLKKINKKLDSLNAYCSTPIIEQSMKYLRNFEWNTVKESYCHGDLTFENILVKNDDIYVIDFLDSFIDSKYIDIAKVLQDVDIYWSVRNKKIDSNLLIRYQVIKKALLSNLTIKEREVSYTLLLLNMLRILPYTKDDKTKQFIYKKIEFVNFILERGAYE